MATSKASQRVLEVYLDSALSEGTKLIGELTCEQRTQIRFQYNKSWIEDPNAFNIDPGLTLDRAPFFPNPAQSNFGIFMDSSPDRWGQKLMDRRERIMAHDENRQARGLTAWDYLVGVQDLTRMGALRYKFPGDGPFLDNHPYPAPPVTSLAQIEAIASEIQGSQPHKIDELRKWLAVLVAPGASLGGAHPKANFRNADGSLWIAKFPSRDDTRDNALWEKLVHDLSHEAQIERPISVVKQFGNQFHTFCVKRFDRTGEQRHFFVSAMTALRVTDGTEGSYLGLAEFIQNNGAPKTITADLHQLFRRVIFNAMIGNRDDHLRNHGFMLTKEGWRLAPAYDMNPSIDKHEHVLSFDGTVHAPDLKLIQTTAAFYDLDESHAGKIIEEIGGVVSTWKPKARRLGISAADVALTASAFTLPPSGGGGARPTHRYPAPG